MMVALGSEVEKAKEELKAKIENDIADAINKFNKEHEMVVDVRIENSREMTKVGWIYGIAVKVVFAGS